MLSLFIFYLTFFRSFLKGMSEHITDNHTDGNQVTVMTNIFTSKVVNYNHSRTTDQFIILTSLATGSNTSADVANTAKPITLNATLKANHTMFESKSTGYSNTPNKNIYNITASNVTVSISINISQSIDFSSNSVESDKATSQFVNNITVPAATPRAATFYVRTLLQDAYNESTIPSIIHSLSLFSTTGITFYEAVEPPEEYENIDQEPLIPFQEKITGSSVAFSSIIAIIIGLVVIAIVTKVALVWKARRLRSNYHMIE